MAVKSPTTINVGGRVVHLAPRRRPPRRPTTPARKPSRVERPATPKSSRPPAATVRRSKTPYEALRRAERKLARRDNPALKGATKLLRRALAEEAAFKARRKTPEGTAIEANKPDKRLKKVAPRAYAKALRAAKPGGHFSSRGLGQPEDLTTAITLVAPGAGFAGALGKRALEVGGKQVAKEIGTAAAGKLENTAIKAETKALRAGSGVKAAGRLASRGARRVTGRQAAKGASRAAAKKAAGRESRYAQVALPGAKLGKVAGIQGLPAARGHEQAIVHNPRAVAKRTAVGAEGLVLGPLKAAADIAATSGRAASTVAHGLGAPTKGYSSSEILAPVKGLGREQLDFAKQVAKVVTASDPDFVQKEVEDNLGLMLPVVLGLGAKTAGGKLTRGRVVEGVRKIANKARKEPLGDFRGRTPRVFEKQGQHKAEARRIANAKARAKRDEQGATGRYIHMARGAKGGEIIRRDVRPKKGRVARAVSRDLSRAEAEGHLVVRPADVIPFATRHSIDLSNPAKAIAQVKAHRASLEDLPQGAKLPAGKLHTRDLLDYIERNADVLASPHVRKALEERRKVGAYRRENAMELAPEHSERARYASVATVKRRPLPEHMFPKDVRDIVRAKPKHGELAKDALRREAREDKAHANKLRRKAATLTHKANVARGELHTREKLNKTNLGMRPTKSQLRELKAIRAMERRGVIPPEIMPVRANLTIAGKGRLHEGRSLPTSHERLRQRIDDMEVQAANLREQAKVALGMSKRKHRAAQGFDPTLEAEFVKREAADLEREGRPQPEYVHTGRAREAPSYGAGGAKLSQFPGKSKFRKGSAERYGMVEEGLVPDIRESFRRPAVRRESYRALRGMLDDNEFRVHGKAEWTSDEIRELYDNGVLDRRQWVAVPRQLYKRAYGKFDPDVATAEMKLALEGKSPGRHFKLVRKPAADQFFSQLSDALVSSKLVKVNRATNFLILSTSPAWATAQVAAEYVQGSIAQPKLLNPRFVKKAMREYKAMPPHKRQAFDAWVGVTSRELSRKEEMGFGTVEDAADAYSAFHSTPLGKVINSIHDFDQWKGGRIRTLVTIAKADKELNGHLNGFVRGLGKLDQEMGRQMKAMRGKPLRDQLSFIADHPKLADRYQTYLDDVMGNWTALTKNERVASQLMIFYPFLRMSLRWTFYAFPKHHPIRTATLAYLSQQNATEIKRLMGGDPSYFTGWLKVPIHLGGKDVSYVPLARIVPGANAPLEALGGGIEGPKGTVALRTAQPGVGAAATLATGVNPLTGKQEKGSFWNAVEQLFPTSLSAPGRALNEAVLPGGRKPAEGVGQILPFLSNDRQEALDKLSGKLTGYGTSERYLRTLAVPALPESGKRVNDKELLGRIMRALEKNSPTVHKKLAGEYSDRIKNLREEARELREGGKSPKAKIKLANKLRAEGIKRLDGVGKTYDEAGNLLDKLFEKYKIPYKREDELFNEEYGRLEYGSEPEGPTSIGGTTIGGAPVSTVGQSTIGGAPARHGSGRVSSSSARQSRATTIGGVPIR